MHAVKARQGWSKSDLANEFGIDRRRVDTLLEGVEARGNKFRGHPTYWIADVALPLAQYAKKQTTPNSQPQTDDDGNDLVIGLGEGQLHPDKLDPKSRKEWYDGEKVRKIMLKDDADLVPKSEVRAGQASLFKTMKAFLLTLPDVLERDAGLPPKAIARTAVLADKLCDNFADLAND